MTSTLIYWKNNMAADSITIQYQESSYSFNINNGLPPAFDSIRGFKEIVQEYRNANMNNIQPENLYAWSAFALLIGLALLARVVHRSSWNRQGQQPDDIQLPNRDYHILSGREIRFSRPVLHKVLTRYFIYYRNLCHTEQNRFLLRLENFIDSKTFIIPAAEAYREMPILISASAIQLTFGLKEYLLPWFENICVHPREYILDNPLRTLAGNVQGNTITLSWKHFLSDYQRQDGVNVGLHEMAHALQMQCEYFYNRKGRDFREAYGMLQSIDDHVIALEKSSTAQVYSTYALTNADEFWASSVELFFERPNQLKTVYPQVYDVLRSLLRQDLTTSDTQPRIHF